jgi:hypothetical protein
MSAVVSSIEVAVGGTEAVSRDAVVRATEGAIPTRDIGVSELHK